MTIKPRAGSKLYKGREVPENCKIYTSELNREFRIACPNDNIIQFIDNGEYKIITKKQLNSITNKNR